MALQTGGGRQTLCEVHVRNGGEFSIAVDPCTADEVQHYVTEFCDDLLSEFNSEKKSSAGRGVSAEADRAIRNMTGLTVKRTKAPDGKVVRDDSALDLVKAFSKREDLIVQVLTRLELPRRNRTSISFPRDSAQSGLDWVSKTFAEINYGRHPEFSIPRRFSKPNPNRFG